MSEERFPLAHDSFGPEEIEAATAVMRSGRYTMGEQVLAFESELAQWAGAKHALMVNSGSSANLLIVESLLRSAKQKGHLKAGDEVLVPALSWPTTVWPLLQLGLVPVFVDVDPVTLAIDVNSAANAVSSKTKALFLIHVLGLAADMKAIGQFVERHQLLLIEDCCESFGAFFEGKHVGLFGHSGSLSHFFSHHLTTMEGGTILCQDNRLLDDLKSFRAHGWTRDRSDKSEWIEANPHLDPRFLFVTTGYNVRPMEIQAAIGRVQLKKADEFLHKRQKVAEIAAEVCDKMGAIRLIGREFIGSSSKGERQSRRHSWMNLPFVIESPKLSRKQVMDQLESCGVETRPIIAGNLSQHPACKGNQASVVNRVPLGTCDNILSKGFMIGCHPGVSERQIETLRKALLSVGELR